MSGPKDAQGVEIQVGDEVMVTAWGGRIHKGMIRERATVSGFTPRGNVLYADRLPHLTELPPSLNPVYISVLNRVTGEGWEGNRQKKEGQADG